MTSPKSPSSPIPMSTPTFATASPATPSTSKAMFSENMWSTICRQDTTRGNPNRISRSRASSKKAFRRLAFQRSSHEPAPVQAEPKCDRSQSSTDKPQFESQLVRRISWRHERHNNSDQDSYKSKNADDPNAGLASWNQHGIFVLGAV